MGSVYKRGRTWCVLLMSGAALVSVQRLLGHSDPKITERRYGHLLPDFMAAEVNRRRFGLDRFAPKNLGTPLVQPTDSGNTEAGTPSVSREVPASLLAGCRGLEPLASGVTEGEDGLGGGGRASQDLGNARSGADGSCTDSQRFAGVLPALGIPLVSGRQTDVESVRWVSVRELAGMLRVSTSTVYQAVAGGRIPHLRVSNAIRFLVPSPRSGARRKA
jgi:excisionase family DNA binding protein